MFNQLKLPILEILKNKNIYLRCGYHMHVYDSDRFVCYKGRAVRDKKYKFWNEETAVDKLYFRCLHIESLGIIPCIRNVSRDWEEYKNLKPNINSPSAYPLVVDDYCESRDIWRRIDEEHYDWYLNSVPPITMKNNGFLAGEPYTHDDMGNGVYLACKEYNHRFYAKLMTLKEFKVKIREKIDA